MTADYRAYADAAIETLLSWYDDATGLWKDTGWWNSANALGTVVDYSSWTRNTDYYTIISNTYEKQKSGDFINEYYDDEGWWALTWLKAYDLTGEIRYLQAAQILFHDMQQGWDPAAGGIWWRKKKDYKATIANELFLHLAARLHSRTSRLVGPTMFLDWALRSWQWLAKSGLINRSYLVEDGIGDGRLWTYNQGVILGGLVDLHESTRDVSLLYVAQCIADAAIATLTGPTGILRDPPEPVGVDSADQPQFKGVFVRNLASLHRTLDRPNYREFILRNADAIWQNSRGATWQFGSMWDSKFDSGNPARQSSALDAILAAMAIQEEEKKANEKPIRHYLLFRSDGSTGWAENAWATSSYVARFQPTCGFSVEEAMQARRVTIVGDEWGCALEERLRQAGCEVERLAGRGGEDIAAQLDDRVRYGRAFVGGTQRLG